MKFSGFMNGCSGKILTIVLSVILGVVLTLGGIVGGGYYILSSKGMLQKAEDMAKDRGIAVDFDDEVAQGTILDWGKQLLAAFQNTEGSTIGALEKLIGVSILSNTLSQMLGIQPEIFKESTIGDVGSTVSANLTMSIAKDKFGITFPDMPIFADEEFLAKPIGEAFGDFDNYKLGDVINIDANAHAALKALSDTPINQIGSEAAKEKINSLSLCELMTIDDNASSTLKALKYNTIDSSYEYVEGTDQILTDANGRYVYKTKTLTIVDPDDNSVSKITVEMQGISDRLKELKVAEVIEITPASNAVLRRMRTATTGERENLDPTDLTIYIQNYISDLYTNAYPTGFDAVIISDYNGVDQSTVDAMPLTMKAGYLFDYLSNNKSDATYSKSWEQLESEACGFGAEDMLIEELGGSKFNELVDNTKIGEFITVDSNSEQILQALQHTKIKDLNGRIGTLRLDEIFAPADLADGALSLIDPATTLSGIPAAITGTVKDSTIAVLHGKGVIDNSAFTNMNNVNLKQRSFIYNNSVSGFLSGVIDFIATPIIEDPLPRPNFDVIQFDDKDLTGNASFTSLTEFVEAYNQHEYLSLDAAVTVTVDTDPESEDYRNFYNETYACFCIPVLSLETATVITFTDGTDSVTVKLAVYDFDGTDYTFAKHQYAFFYAPLNALEYIDTLTYAVKP